METLTKTETGTDVLSSPEVQTWSLDKAHAKLGFNITHLLVSEIHGSFKAFEASITSEGEGFENAKIELSADVESINTENADRDNHLRQIDFFDSKKFPSLTFKSSSIKKVGDNKYILTGELTLMGVTKTVELDVIAVQAIHPFNQKTIAGFKGTGFVKRSDFGLGPNFPALALSDKVEITANAEFIKN
jgi:polyisoprenoid-binding protein YceI